MYFDRERGVLREDLLKMRDVLYHRGPDDAGWVVEENVGLGHRRLSIIDLSIRSRQPMLSASGRFWVTYNGEIYNYRELRAQLEGLGHRFRTSSDTEVLVEGLDTWGIRDLLPMLDGIFAFAAWDRSRGELAIACDPLGVKPVFYHATSQSFFFASEMKALWAGGVPKRFDEETLEELLVFRTVAGEGTPFHGIHRVLPGHYLTASTHGLQIHRYWSAAEHVGDDPDCARIWRDRFAKAVQNQRISDVPIGTLLSGGIDSSTVTAELARNTTSSALQTFTVSVPPAEGLDEWPFAESVAARWGCRAHQLRVPSGDVLDRLRQAQTYHDEPLAHGNDMHLFELSRMARNHVKVLLSGEGADETLGGYVRYQPVRYPRMLALGISAVGLPVRALLSLAQRRELRSLRRMLTLRSLDDVLLYNAADVLPADLKIMGFPVRERFEARRAILEQAQRTTADRVKQVMLYDIQTFLRSILNRNDRMTMGASIECRVPFLSVGVVEAALKIPSHMLFRGKHGKQVLREHAATLLPSKVLRRRKWGLGIPWNLYLRSDPACRSFLMRSPSGPFREMLPAWRLAAAIADFLNGDDRRAPLIYQVFALTVWWEQVVEGAQQWGPNARLSPASGSMP